MIPQQWEDIHLGVTECNSCSFNDKQSTHAIHDERGRNSCMGHGQDTCRDTASGGPLNYICGDWFLDTPLIVGVFSYFLTSKPTSETLQNTMDVYIMTGNPILTHMLTMRAVC